MFSKSCNLAFRESYGYVDCVLHKLCDFYNINMNHYKGNTRGRSKKNLPTDRAWGISHICLTTAWTINGMVRFINTNDELNVYVDRNNATNTLFTKSDFN